MAIQNIYRSVIRFTKQNVTDSHSHRGELPGQRVVVKRVQPGIRFVGQDQEKKPGRERQGRQDGEWADPRETLQALQGDWLYE